MSQELVDKAKRLSSRGYVSVVVLDKDLNGDPIYVAYSPELEGCMSQGRTPVEASKNLNSAREDYILSLLMDNLPIPDPGRTATTSTTAGPSFDFSKSESRRSVFNQQYEITLSK